jgi:oligopeptide/dipeptide ABC transporter ATP-binding protein
VLVLHHGLTRESAGREAQRLLERVRIGDAARRLERYPHELSGGMRQRVMIALALASRPQLLILDEPTSALDVTVQAELLDLLRELRRESGLGLVLITHDFAVVHGLADRVVVMYAGRIVEEAGTAELFRAPRHPYSAGLLGAMPRLSDPVDRDLAIIPGQAAVSAGEPGCAFAPRCERATEVCTQQTPALTGSGVVGRSVACHHPLLEPAIP